MTALNSLIERTFSCVLVYLFHAVPNYVVGDLLFNRDGSSFAWHFDQSGYIALVDATFDYKHERQANLDEVRARRQRTVRFHAQRA